jgi:oxygen-independent coproporphyrinogen-3 oxidase
MEARQDDTLAAEHYALAEEILAAAGYEHYELSSWARPGHAARHNGAYWARRPYTGIGAGAHSYDGAAARAWNTRDLDAYLAGIAAGQLPRAGEEQLDEPTRAFEAISLGLRRVKGVSRDAFRAEFGADPCHRFGEAVREGLSRGLLEVDDEALRLSAPGRLLANEALVGFAPALSGAR